MQFFHRFQSKTSTLVTTCLAALGISAITANQAAAWTWHGGYSFLASLDQMDNQGNHHSGYPSISIDGRFVTFSSEADNLVSGDTNGKEDIFIKDLVSKQIRRVNTSSSGEQANAESIYSFSPVSENGRFVAFTSKASNLVAGDTNGVSDLFVKDMDTGTVERASVSSTGTEANEMTGTLNSASISADGRFVVFRSAASNLVPGDTNGEVDAFLHDLVTGTTERLSTNSSGVQGDSYTFAPTISADGSHVAFCSRANNLVPSDTNVYPDCFVRDRDQASSIQRVSVKTGGSESTGYSEEEIALSENGRYALFVSRGDDLDPADPNKDEDIFRHDISTNTTILVSSTADGKAASPSIGTAPTVSLSLDGQTAVFYSYADQLVPGETPKTTVDNDIFVKHIPTQAIIRLSSKPDGTETSRSSHSGVMNNREGLIVYSTFSDEIIPTDSNRREDIIVAKPVIKRFPFPKP